MELLCDNFLGQPTFRQQPLDADDAVGAEIRTTTTVVRSMPPLVLFVFVSRRVSQVVSAGIFAISIVVAALATFWTWAVKGFDDQCVNVATRSLAVHHRVPGFNFPRGDHSTAKEAARAIGNDDGSIYRFDSSETAGFIARETRDWLPNLGSGNVAVRHADLQLGSCVQGRDDAQTSSRPAHFPLFPRTTQEEI